MLQIPCAALRLEQNRKQARYQGMDGGWRDRDPQWCAWRCADTWSVWSCNRRSGHGHEGAYCKQHAQMDAALDT